MNYLTNLFPLLGAVLCAAPLFGCSNSEPEEQPKGPLALELEAAAAAGLGEL